MAAAFASLSPSTDILRHSIDHGRSLGPKNRSICLCFGVRVVRRGLDDPEPVWVQLVLGGLGFVLAIVRVLWRSQ